MEYLQQIFKWCFVQDPLDKKYLENINYPLFSAAFFIICMTWVSIILANYFEKKYPELKENLPEWSKNKFHIAFHIIYFCFLMGSRIYFEGIFHFYDFLWACNQCYLYFILGLILNKPLLVSGGILCIAVDQILWYIDIIGYFIIGKLPFNVVGYLFWDQTPLINKITCTHHLWFIPLGIFVLKNSKYFMKCAMKFTFILTVLFAWISILLIPFTIQNKEGKEIYMNLNVSRRSQKGIGMKFLTQFDDVYIWNWFPVYHLWHLFIWNFTNFLCLLLIYLFHFAINIDKLFSKNSTTKINGHNNHNITNGNNKNNYNKNKKRE